MDQQQQIGCYMLKVRKISKKSDKNIANFSNIISVILPILCLTMISACSNTTHTSKVDDIILEKREPITRLAFVPILDLQKKPSTTEKQAQTIAKIETASGEAEQPIKDSKNNK